MTPRPKSTTATATSMRAEPSEKDIYIAQLKQEVADLKVEISALKAKGGGKRTKASLIKTTCMSRADVLFTDKVWRFCQEFLFTRIKFLPKGWKIYDANSTTNFASVVKRHIPVAEDVSFGGEWERIMIDAIIRKYTDMRCNVKNNIRKAFKGKYFINIWIYTIANTHFDVSFILS